MRVVPAISLLVSLSLLAGCSGNKAPNAAPSASPPATSSAAPPSPATPPAQTPVTARAVHDNNDLYEFDYSYPASAGAIPALKALLDTDLDKTRTGLIADAREGRKLSQESDFPYHPYSHHIEWQVVTDLPAWLSMSTLVGTYSGGAHPNYGYDTILWDRIAGKRRAPTDLFASKSALSASLRAPFCKELDRQRAKKRGGEEPSGRISEFAECIDPAEQTVILGSSNGKAFDRIGVLVAPYAAGPYAEGSYEVTVPVTASVLAAVKPEFRNSFVAK
ncbi:DUF4163 domain-containing protein [Novosphingobium sp. SL115]|uniref:DUF4163 domain-containing protein n=1 Tax=Novosphingobium sp. SL115 TaxID=2995150 RepID=UPI0022760910|nr:DUF4163 domain-containing protein [Novosphingobium sp. SL115]MCY1672352.1 DUF4163 domain-containing protein [Novosphingobium sp. SL115]